MAQTNVGEQCCSELGAQYWEGLLWRGNACSNLSHPFNFNTLFMLHSFCVLAPRYIPSWSLRVVWYHLSIIHDSLQTTIISFTLTYLQISAIIVVDELRTVLLFVSSKYHFSPGPFIQHGVGKVTFLAKFSYCLMRPRLRCLSSWKFWLLKTPVRSPSSHFCLLEGSLRWTFPSALASVKRDSFGDNLILILLSWLDALF